ncbi:MAG: riboflavin synthase [Ilumatobacteraceae bacterium]|jgi:riboflavin synthase
MFTGIIEEMGTVRDRETVQTDWGEATRLSITARKVLEGSFLGASIAVNGCCLTLVDRGNDEDGDWWATEMSAETMMRTALGTVRRGDRVNLERPMALGDRLGGHLVLGHVDCVGEVVTPAPDLVVRLPAAQMGYLVEKGSIAVDGISLTVFDLTDDTFRVAVIPHTANVTTLGVRVPGDTVNIELDILAKHVERLMEPYRS